MVCEDLVKYRLRTAFLILASLPNRGNSRVTDEGHFWSLKAYSQVPKRKFEELCFIFSFCSPSRNSTVRRKVN